ncbi:MAG: amidohydrolase family protein [Victivallales bacterium]|nr:amidohydrolase family protein [Victivallales bacterium]
MTNFESIFNDRDRAIYEREFRKWLPKRIFDAHVHLFDSSCLVPGFDFPEKSCYRKFDCEYAFETHSALMRAMLPEQEVAFNSFGHPDVEIDLDASARYSGKISDGFASFAMALISPKDPIENVIRRVEENNLVGYKPYLNYVDWKPSSEVEIFDMLTDEQMRYADEKGLIVTLHIPRPGRLADPVNQRQMVEICDRYPNAKIIFAHIGRAYYMSNVIGGLAEIAERSNAYIDTAMVNHECILEYAFNNFPRKRILFGSDSPIALLRGKSVEINDQYAYLMAEDYRIGTAIYDSENAVDFTTFFYEQLRGIKRAAEKVGLSRGELAGILHDNAVKLFSV